MKSKVHKSKLDSGHQLLTTTIIISLKNKYNTWYLIYIIPNTAVLVLQILIQFSVPTGPTVTRQSSQFSYSLLGRFLEYGGQQLFFFKLIHA